MWLTHLTLGASLYCIAAVLKPTQGSNNDDCYLLFGFDPQERKAAHYITFTENLKLPEY